MSYSQFCPITSCPTNDLQCILSSIFGICFPILQSGSDLIYPSPDDVAYDEVRPPSALKILLDGVRHYRSQLDREEVRCRRYAAKPLRSEMFQTIQFRLICLFGGYSRDTVLCTCLGCQPAQGTRRVVRSR